jgi:hypothetical protein
MLRHFVNPLPGQPRIFLPSSDCCVYCGCKSLLTDEHLIADNIGGRIILPNASCHVCMEETHAFEGQFVRQYCDPFRQRVGIRGKRRGKKKIPRKFKKLESLAPSPETAAYTWVGADEHPSSLTLLVLSPPTLIGGMVPVTVIQGFQLPVDTIGMRTDVGGGWYFQYEINPFVRTIAKIAHCAAIATFGYGAFEPRLAEAVRGNLEGINEVVGGTPAHLKFLPFDYPKGMHEIAVTTVEIAGQKHAIVQIRFFSAVLRTEFPFLTRTYLAIAGRLL